jgi:hypothetical protein
MPCEKGQEGQEGQESEEGKEVDVITSSLARSE